MSIERIIRRVKSLAYSVKFDKNRDSILIKLFSEFGKQYVAIYHKSKDESSIVEILDAKDVDFDALKNRIAEEFMHWVVNVDNIEGTILIYK